MNAESTHSAASVLHLQVWTTPRIGESWTVYATINHSIITEDPTYYHVEDPFMWCVRVRVRVCVWCYLHQDFIRDSNHTRSVCLARVLCSIVQRIHIRTHTPVLPYTHVHSLLIVHLQARQAVQLAHHQPRLPQ